MATHTGHRCCIFSEYILQLVLHVIASIAHERGWLKPGTRMLSQSCHRLFLKRRTWTLKQKYNTRKRFITSLKGKHHFAVSTLLASNQELIWSDCEQTHEALDCCTDCVHSVWWVYCHPLAEPSLPLQVSCYASNAMVLVSRGCRKHLCL